MGLFRKRKSRATRRAEARAIKTRAKLEARLAAKNEARRIKDDRRAADKVLKAQTKSQRDSDRTALKVAEAELKAAREGKLLSPTRIRRVLTVSRLLAPVLTPLIYRAAIAARADSRARAGRSALPPPPLPAACPLTPDAAGGGRPAAGVAGRRPGRDERASAAVAGQGF